jgi:medium-chain acyl-[acyl-carrier-protein] hydrolase
MSTQLWLRRLRPNPQAQLRLFCFHFAGGSASVYRTWPAALANRRPDIEVCAVQLPGRENRLKEQPFTQIEPLVTTLLNVLHADLDRPFALFGHSMGAIVAYEVAQALARHRAAPPNHLFVSARRAPSEPERYAPLHQEPTEDALLRAIQQRYGNLPELLLQDAELKAIYAPLLRADFTLVERYQPSSLAPLACPLTVFGGIADPIATAAELAAWRTLTQSQFAIHLLPGGHFYLQEQSGPLLDRIAAALSVPARS